MEGAKEESFNVDEFSKKGFKAMVAATRAFQCLPQPGPLWDLRKSYPEFSRGLKLSRSRLITLMIKLLQHAKLTPDDFKGRDVEEKFDFIVESNDELLERIATSLDKAEGLFQRAEMVVVNPTVSANAAIPPGTWKEKKLIRLNDGPETEIEQVPIEKSTRAVLKPRYRNKVREKPQLRFSSSVDNSTGPFVPKLREKPNSIKPLSILPEFNDNNEEFYGHPYTVELNQWKPIASMLEVAKNPNRPPGLSSARFLLVENARQMETMLEDLANAKEIAVDLEHHSYRSFLGLTCLLQISTRTHDYVVDGLSLRDEMYHLNEVFTNPRVLKVFHGASSDIPWLQKDFGVYVVGMFDTSIAAKLLNLRQTSLQFLLQELCDVSTDKSFQLADWRIRPLSPEMIQYARADTHYLLYIYDLLKQRLYDAGNEDNLIRSVYEQSCLLCLKRFEKPSNNPQVALRKSRRSFNNRQLYCFTELFKWRDSVAREKDESLGYVLPNHMLLTIAETLPKEMTGIMACCDPVPHLVHGNLGHIHRIVLKSRELPMHDTSEASNQNKSQKKVKQRNWMLMMNSVYEVHELDMNEQEFSFNKRDWNVDLSEFKAKSGPTIKFNSSSCTAEANNLCQQECKEMAPYQRYRLTNEIIEKFKDPKKKMELDMTDPRVKAVVETIMNDPFHQAKEEDEEITSAPSKQQVFDMEFVPFNPMSVPKGVKKAKKRKNTQIS